MCGICGQLNFAKAEAIDSLCLDRMVDILTHRGPDEYGIHLGWPMDEKNYRLGLGVRRLAIIDLKTGAQPIHNEDKTVWIVFNGEIYNFRQLREDLEKKGHKFYTKTDTESIVHLYEEEGEDCVLHLRGMFAFAIWDEKKKILFLARDRLGQKPLVYTVQSGSIIFASELKAIIANPKVSRQIDPVALDYYLSFEYVPSPLSILKGINKLPPATTLTCDSTGRIKTRRYWDLSYSKKLNLSVKEINEEILLRLKEAVKLRLISDVPLGVFLSGGIDSSTVVALMRQLNSGEIRTFTIGFSEDSQEIRLARIISKLFDTQHNEFIVRPNIIESMPKLARFYDEPFADSSAIVTYYLASQLKDYATVALNGDGGDENFAGYDWYGLNILIYRYIFRGLSENLLVKLRPIILGRTHTVNRNLFGQFRRLLWLASLNPFRRSFYMRAAFDEEEKANIYTGSFLREMNAPFKYIEEVYKKAKCKDLLDSMLYTDIMTYLPDDLLYKMDIGTMANSKEARSPFLDHKFMEFTAQINSNLKFKGLTSKYILKQAVRKLLPREIIEQPKTGFGIPLKRWLGKDLMDYAQSILLDRKSIKRGYFRENAIRQLLDEQISGRAFHGSRIWTLIILELWHRTFIDA